MVLSDADIITRIGQDELVIDPYDESNVEPASVDLRLGEDFTLPQQKSLQPVDLSGDDEPFEYINETGSIVLDSPNSSGYGGFSFALATTLERVEVPDDMVAHVLGRSSLGRLGISVHQTAGYIDPGFEGQITLELSNHGPAPVRLESGQRICQIVFEDLSSECLTPYGHSGSHYQNQSGATPSTLSFE